MGAVAITLRIEGSTVEARTRDFGLGGLFVLTDVHAEPESTLHAIFHLPALGETIETPVLVRWSTTGGLGLQFMSLRAAEAWGINQLLRVD